MEVSKISALTERGILKLWFPFAASVIGVPMALLIERMCDDDLLIKAAELEALGSALLADS